MSSSKVLTNLNIRKYPSYESYKESTPGPDDLCVVDENGDLLLQVTTLPTASAAYEGRVVQLKTNGYFYKCVSDGQDPATYSWTQLEVQPQPYIPDSLEQRYDLSAATENVGKIVQYIGETDANYTNGYVYKVVNVPATATISQTVGSSLSDLTVDADGFINNISGYATGTYVLTYANGIWYYGSAGYDVSTYITYTGTPEEGDEITVEVLTLPTTAWQRCDVQPLGLESLPGFDNTQTQTLKNVQGVLTWVTD